MATLYLTGLPNDMTPENKIADTNNMFTNILLAPPIPAVAGVAAIQADPAAVEQDLLGVYNFI